MCLIKKNERVVSIHCCHLSCQASDGQLCSSALLTAKHRPQGLKIAGAGGVVARRLVFALCI
jgi:hypothetical protein